MQYYLSKDDLQTSLVNPKLARLDRLLLILFWNSEASKSTAEIKKIASDNGLRECVKWNISDSLAKSKGKATLIKGEWLLTTSGRNYLLKQNLITEKKAQLQKDVSDLRSHLSSIKDVNAKSFIEEAVSCLESDQKRAAVVFSWIGAVALLYDHIVKHHLGAFNAEALKRDAKWKNAKNADDLTRMKEYDFLNVLEAISVIGKNVKQELQNSLQLRNSCGHPNSLKIGERKVAAHIEILILNVFSKF